MKQCVLRVGLKSHAEDIPVFIALSGFEVV